MRFRKTANCLLVAIVILMAGCHLRPNFGSPGTIGMQRDRAVLHNPYPDNNLGPPILGGSPLGFDVPRSEATDVQDQPFSRNSLRNPFLLRRPQPVVQQPMGTQSFAPPQIVLPQPAAQPQQQFAPGYSAPTYVPQ